MQILGMSVNLIQRWTIGAGGFIGEVSLFRLTEWDMYVRGKDTRTYVTLSNLHVHPLRRGRGWARLLMQAALTHAMDRGWCVFIRVVPYANGDAMDVDQLIAFYKSYGFVSTRRDPREMVRRWKTTKAK
jgi:ribosomal protein S18 acetylase RimI-like enzyme